MLMLLEDIALEADVADMLVDITCVEIPPRC